MVQDPGRHDHEQAYGSAQQHDLAATLMPGGQRILAAAGGGDQQGVSTDAVIGGNCRLLIGEYSDTFNDTGRRATDGLAKYLRTADVAADKLAQLPVREQQ